MINLHFSELTTGSERLLSKSRCETTTTTDKGVFLVVYFSRVFRVFNTIVFIYFTTFVYFAISTLRQKIVAFPSFINYTLWVNPSAKIPFGIPNHD